MIKKKNHRILKLLLAASISSCGFISAEDIAADAFNPDLPFGQSSVSEPLNPNPNLEAPTPNQNIPTTPSTAPSVQNQNIQAPAPSAQPQPPGQPQFQPSPAGRSEPNQATPPSPIRPSAALPAGTTGQASVPPGTSPGITGLQPGVTGSPTGVNNPETALKPGANGAGVTQKAPPKTILINFNNVSALEFVRFISKISGRNFIFDEDDLRFQVTIVSEEPTTLDNIMAALLQELRIHDLMLTEQGNNIIIHRNPNVNNISTIVADNIPKSETNPNAEIVTRLFRLNTADPDKIAGIIRPLASSKSIIEVFKDTNHLIVTDIATNIAEIATLVKSLDSPNNGLVIGQYAVRNGFIEALIQLAHNVMLPIAQTQTLIFVPHKSANSIFIVSTPFIMERTLALLQYLDQNQGVTRIFDLKDLTFTPEGLPIIPGATGAAGAGVAPAVPGAGAQPAGAGEWRLNNQGSWVFRPTQQAGIPATNEPPEGYWYIDDQGNWHFQAGAAPATPSATPGLRGPEGQWRLAPEGVWFFQLAPGKSISPERLVRPVRGTAELPPGSIERTQFYIYKLQYRKGDQIVNALGNIGVSLSRTTANNADLVSTIESIQWIQASNSLVFTGTAESIEKTRELIAEIDTPLRQVYIEMLVLDTTLTDSLEYGTNWGTQSGGGNTATSQAFLSPGSPLPIALLSTVPPNTPTAASLALQPGFSQGIVGRHLTHGGIVFNSIGALVRAVHQTLDTKVLLAPKILTEDNFPAEIFVGINTPYPTQAIANNNGNIVTQNFDFRDVGTRLRVTPQIGDNDIITLTIDYEDQTIISTGVTQTGTTGPTTNKATARTKVHLPNGFFLVISGFVRDQDDFTINQVPCLGCLPFIGAAFRDNTDTDRKRNLIFFIRPKIIETQDEIDNITKHQQDAYEFHNKKKDMWQYEVDEALDFFNLPHCEECDEDCCSALPRFRH